MDSRCFGKLLLTCLLLVTGSTASTAFAAPCTLGSLQDYLGRFSPGSAGCSAGDITLSDFSLEAIGPNEIPLLTPTVLLQPFASGFDVLTVGQPGLPNELFAGPDVALGLRFGFRASGTAITGGNLALGPHTVTPDGLMILLVDSGFGNAIVFDTGVDQSAPSAATFATPASSFLDLSLELELDGGLNGSVRAGPRLATLSFMSEPMPPPPTSAPEPSSSLLLAVGLFALVLMLRSRWRVDHSG